MATYLTCSWCHELNPVTAPWCAACGHAAHKPRTACDCRACRPGRGGYVDLPEPPTPSPN